MSRGAYIIVEAAVALTAGSVAPSAALIGFGLASIIEVACAAAVAWQFAGPDPQAREHRCGVDRAAGGHRQPAGREVGLDLPDPDTASTSSVTEATNVHRSFP